MSRFIPVAREQASRLPGYFPTILFTPLHLLNHRHAVMSSALRSLRHPDILTMGDEIIARPLAELL